MIYTLLHCGVPCTQNVVCVLMLPVTLYLLCITHYNFYSDTAKTYSWKNMSINMDMSIKKPIQDELKFQFHSWYTNVVSKQLKHVPVHEVKVDVSATVIKSRSCNWIISAWQVME